MKYFQDYWGNGTNFFHNWINELCSEEDKVLKTLLEAQKVAGSAKYKQSVTVWNSVVLEGQSLPVFSLVTHHYLLYSLCHTGIQELLINDTLSSLSLVATHSFVYPFSPSADITVWTRMEEGGQTFSIFSQFWIWVPSQLQHSCLNSTPPSPYSPAGCVCVCVSVSVCVHSIVFLQDGCPDCWHRTTSCFKMQRENVPQMITVVAPHYWSWGTTLITCTVLDWRPGLLCFCAAQSSAGFNLSCKNREGCSVCAGAHICRIRGVTHFCSPSPSIFNQPQFDVYSWATP